MEICVGVYRPRRPKESPLFRLVEQHIEVFLRAYPERFAKAHGPLRPVIERPNADARYAETMREFAWMMLLAKCPEWRRTRE